MGVTANANGIFFGSDVNVLKWFVLMVAQLCKYTKKALNYILKWVYFIVCELYICTINKAVNVTEDFH